MWKRNAFRRQHSPKSAQNQACSTSLHVIGNPCPANGDFPAPEFYSGPATARSECRSDIQEKERGPHPLPSIWHEPEHVLAVGAETRPQSRPAHDPSCRRAMSKVRSCSRAGVRYTAGHYHSGRSCNPGISPQANGAEPGECRHADSSASEKESRRCCFVKETPMRHSQNYKKPLCNSQILESASPRLLQLARFGRFTGARHGIILAFQHTGSRLFYSSTSAHKCLHFSRTTAQDSS
jgi:hypothetical protein